MIDFDDLVLSVGQDTFGRNVLYTPTKSSPGMPAIGARGVYFARPIFVEVEGGSLQTLEHTLSIRRSELPFMPAQNDTLSMNGQEWIVSNVERDSEGALKLTLKAAKP